MVASVWDVDFRLTRDKKRSGYRCIRTVFYRELAAAATVVTTAAVVVVIAAAATTAAK